MTDPATRLAISGMIWTIGTLAAARWYWTRRRVYPIRWKS